MKMTRSFTTAALAIAVTVGCQAPAENANAAGDTPAAVVNGTPISQQTVDLLRQGGQQQGQPRDPEAHLDQLVTLEVLAQKAREQGLDEKPQVRAELWQKQAATLANALIGDYIDAHPVTDKELRAEYDKRVADQAGGVEYKARHILVDDEDKAESLIDELDGGADFAELARAESTGPSGKKGGDLGWFGPERMVPAFSKAVQALEPGHYSESPVKTRFGWHVILLEDTRDKQPPSFDQLKQRIRVDLVNQKLDAYIRDLREAADVTIEQQPQDSGA